MDDRVEAGWQTRTWRPSCSPLHYLILDRKVFLDTDGDRRPSPNTQIAYDFADYCVIPLEPDECDFGRLEPMIESGINASY